MMPDLHDVTNEIIDTCFTRVVELKSDYYFERTDRLSALQKRLLVALTKSGQNIYTADYIMRNQLV